MVRAPNEGCYVRRVRFICLSSIGREKTPFVWFLGCARFVLKLKLTVFV
jgi:hypothetical protein